MDAYSAKHWFVIGHDWAVEQLTRAMNRGRERHAYLLSGTPSIGKTTFAKSIAMALNCLAEAEKPCGECRNCQLILRGSHPDISYVEADRVGGTLKIDQIRELQRTLALRPYEAKRRVAIIRRFHEAHPAAANALLKTLEEPPGEAVIILACDDLGMLLPTIKSRCQILPLHPVPLQTVFDTLTEHFEVNEEDAKLLTHLSGGRLGWAIRALDDESLITQRDEYIQLLEDLLQHPRRNRFTAVESLTKNKNTLEEVLRYWQTYWRDALLVANDNAQWIVNVDREDFLRDLAKRFSVEDFQKALAATSRTLNYLKRNVNTRLAVEAMTLDYPFI